MVVAGAGQVEPTTLSGGVARAYVVLASDCQHLAGLAASRESPFSADLAYGRWTKKRNTAKIHEHIWTKRS